MSSLFLHYLLFVTLVSSALSEIRIIGVTPSPVEIRQGGSQVLRARIEGLPDDISGYIIGWLVQGTKPVGVYGVDVGNYPDEFDASFVQATGEATLTIKSASSSYTGEVTLQVSPPNGDDLPPLLRFELLVLVPPARVEMKVNGGAQVEAENPFQITCTAIESTPAVEMQWFCNDAEVTGATTSAGANSEMLYTTISTLQLTPTSTNNGDVYRCTITGKSMENSMSEERTLNVAYKPIVAMSVLPDQSYQVAGKEVTFSCSADANPGDVSWQWSVGGEPLPGATSSSYTDSNIVAELNEKDLKCTATNSQGSGEDISLLNIYYDAEFTSTPSNVQADLHSTVSRTCDARGNPKPFITWTQMVENIGWRVVANMDTLEIASLRETDFGKYRCTATIGVAYFQDLTTDFYILRNDVPRISNSAQASVSPGQDPFGSVSYGQGEDAVLTCTATCIPAPLKVTWYKGENQYLIDVSNSERYSMTTEQNLDVVEIKLTIKDLASTDFDFYNCTVENERGSDSAIFTLAQNNDFPWKWALGVAAGVIVVGIIIGVVVCMCRRSKNKTSSAGSLSVVSNTTDNSIKKPAEGMEQVDSSSLPEYGMRPIDVWRTNDEPSHSNSFAMDHYNEQQPELYSSRSPAAGSTFNPSNAYPPGNYGSYRVQQAPPSPFHPPAVPPYSTLPLRLTKLPPDAYNRAPYVGTDVMFPLPPPPVGASAESRLATNV